MLVWILVPVAIVVGLVLLRPTLKHWFPSFFSWIEPVEIALWKKSETILFARLKIFIGLLLTFLTQAGAIDITPLMPFVPDQWEGIVKAAWNCVPLAISILGMMDERLRNQTTKPIELIAVAEKDMTPKVEAAIAKVEAVNTQAVAAVVAAEAKV